MKLNITKKLFLIAALPIITLIIYSFNHLNEKYSSLLEDEQNIVKLKTIEYASYLLHELQIERGASFSLLHKVNDVYFLPLVQEQTKKTDSLVLKFMQHSKALTTVQNSIEQIQSSLDSIVKIREAVVTNSMNPDKVFEFYTNLNSQLISLINSFKFSSNSKELSSNVSALFHLIKLQEYAGQERALVSKLIVSNGITNHEMQTYHNLLSMQENEYEAIQFLLEDAKSKENIFNTRNKYSKTYFFTAREEILNHDSEKQLLNSIYSTLGLGGLLHDLHLYDLNKDKKYFESFEAKLQKFNLLMLQYLALSDKKDEEYLTTKKLQNYFQDVTPINYKFLNDEELFGLYNSLYAHHITLDSVKWFQISTNRIDEIHNSEHTLFNAIFNAINQNIQENKSFLIYQTVITILIILLLLAANYFISRNIKKSISTLNNGINKFFDFLNGKVDHIQEITINSHDEINDMAQSINKQVHIIEKSLEQDLDFINETTQIVMLMKDGNFSERPYFEPHNTHLKELKDVFHELIELIAQKIKEQTDSLEALNASLEDRVHFQTLELEKQIQEITIAMDKAIAAEKSKDEFLANMSHEIRTPLNAILGFVTILKKQIKEEKQLHYLNIIDTSGKSLLTIINDILDFSKIQSGKFQISPHEVDIVEEMSNAILLFASKAYEKHLIYDSYIDPKMPRKILVDEVRLKQIFSNILSNAIKFTNNDKSVKVDVTIINSILTISVQDTGIGISKENIPKVFKAFEQADGSTTRKYGGTGLGMSISKKLAELMNGTIEIDSTEGVGSTFTLKIPITIVNQESYTSPTLLQLQQKSIAVLDFYQNSIKLQLIKRYLRDFGVTNIVELSSFEADGYDLIFFIPDDLHNEDIVENDKPAIAILRNSSLQLASFDHIAPLYAPFTPKAILQAIDETNVLQANKPTTTQTTMDIKKSLEEIQFDGSVLVAEDNTTNQMLISLLLDAYSLKYKIVPNGLEAIEAYKKEKFDLILMDENMPELNGIGAMKQIKEYERLHNLSHIPIIVVTASVLEQDKEKFASAGMDGFVAKPIHTTELTNELSKFLKKL